MVQVHHPVTAHPHSRRRPTDGRARGRGHRDRGDRRLRRRWTAAAADRRGRRAVCRRAPGRRARDPRRQRLHRAAGRVQGELARLLRLGRRRRPARRRDARKPRRPCAGRPLRVRPPGHAEALLPPARRGRRAVPRRLEHPRPGAAAMARIGAGVLGRALEGRGHAPPGLQLRRLPGRLARAKPPGADLRAHRGRPRARRARPQLPALRAARRRDLRRARRRRRHALSAAVVPDCLSTRVRARAAHGWLYLRAEEGSLRVRAISRWGGVHDDFRLYP